MEAFKLSYHEEVQRDPTQSSLYKVINKTYKKVLFEKEQRGESNPFHVQREFEKYLTCGVLAHGFVRLKCSFCTNEKLVPFSCKGRTLCPSCTGRNMADSAKHLVEEVIPAIPIRQWVLSLPYKHRYFLAYDKKLNTQILNTVIRAISTFYKKGVRKRYKIEKGKTGSITVIQRFGGALNLNTHFHILFTDGAYNESGHFFPFSPKDQDIEALLIKIKTRVNRILSKRGILDDLDLEELDPELNSGKDYHAQSVLNLVDEEGRFQRPTEIGKKYDPPFEILRGNKCGYLDGFSLHANSRIPSHARGGLEKMCRYILRGPLSQSRIQAAKNGRVILKLKTPYKSGTTHLSFSPEQFIKRLMALIPPPRMNLIRYHGVFAANHKKRKSITDKAKRLSEKKNKRKEIPKKKKYRTPWAELLKHVFLKDALTCNRCGESLEYVITIKDPRVAIKILDHLNYPTELQSFDNSRGPPTQELFESSPSDFFCQETSW